MIPYIMPALALLGAMLHLIVTKRNKTIGYLAQLLLGYSLLLWVITALITNSYASHLFPQTWWNYLTWLPNQASLQMEFYLINSGFLLLALASLIVDTRIQIPLLLLQALVSLAISYQHMRDIALYRHYSWFSANIMLIMDIFTPIFFIGLILANSKRKLTES